MNAAAGAAILRRTCFACLLLSAGAIAAVGGHYGLNSDSRTLTAGGTFLWGTENVGIILAAWLVGRQRVWGSAGGWARALAYLLAFVSGRMLFDVTGNWLHQRDEPVYDRPFFEGPAVLACAWLLLPVFALLRGKLAGTQTEGTTRAGFTLASLVAWTAITALILAWIRFLTLQEVLPTHPLNYMTYTEAIRDYAIDWFAGLPIRVVAVMIIVLAWSGKRWMPPVALAGAILLDVFGSRAIYAGLAGLTGESFDSYIPAGTDIRSWAFIAGRNTIAWVAFGGAALTGVRFRRGSPVPDRQMHLSNGANDA